LDYFMTTHLKGAARDIAASRRTSVHGSRILQAACKFCGIDAQTLCCSGAGAIGGLHLLPAYPSSGDGGFAPITYQVSQDACTGFSCASTHDMCWKAIGERLAKLQLAPTGD